MKDKIFYCVCGLLFVTTAVLLMNLWYKFIPLIQFDKYVVLLFFTAMGFLLLPFADKIKIGNFLEIERLKEKIQRVELTQYLGEVIRNDAGDVFYYDNDGKHKLPDKETAAFLRTNKGEISVSKETMNQMKTSYTINSVTTSEKVRWGNHIFAILNEKKYWMSIANLSDCGVTENEIEGFRRITDEDIRLIPTGK